MKRILNAVWLLLLPFFVLAGCSLIIPGETKFHAIVIGINEYIEPTISDLKYCLNDANGMNDRLLQRGWHDSEITLLLDGEATKDAILQAIGSAVDSCGPEDYILVYFSGHGSSVSDSSGDEYDGVDEAIVPVDFVWGDPSTLVLDDELGASFGGCPTEKGVFIFDSCNSGGIVSTLMQASAGVQSRYFPADARGGGGENGDLDVMHIPVMTASAEDEDSFEYASLQHGAFTYFVLEGLSGHSADSNSDGYITIREVFNYAEIQTEHYTGQYQHPLLRFHRNFLDILITR